MASILKVDDLRGNTSAGDITITSEGGAATQSLQQGLAKAWASWNGAGTLAVNDSLNLSSVSDLGTGNYQMNFSSSLNNDDYAYNFTGNGRAESSRFLHSAMDYTVATGSLQMYWSGNLNGVSWGIAYCDTNASLAVVHGDLA